MRVLNAAILATIMSVPQLAARPADFAVLPADFAVAGTSLSGWGRKWVNLVVRKNPLRGHLMRVWRSDNSNFLYGQQGPTLLLAAYYCAEPWTPAGSNDLAKCSNGQQPGPLYREGTLSFAEYQYVYLPLINFGYSADPVTCDQLSVPSGAECDAAIKGLCEAQVAASGAFQVLQYSVNGQDYAIPKPPVVLGNSPVNYVNPAWPPGYWEPEGAIDPPYYGCQLAMASMIQIKSKGDLLIKFSALNGQGYYTGDVTYMIHVV